MKFTPENITSLEKYQIFVFGSNRQGRHGKGAAKIAVDKFGAKYGNAYGMQGQSYAIVTKELRHSVGKVTLKEIEHQVNVLFKFAIENREKEFLVTKIGCGLGGYSTEDLKEVFKNVMKKNGLPSNVRVPKEFIF